MYLFKRTKELPCHKITDSLIPFEEINESDQVFDYAIEVFNGWLVSAKEQMYICPPDTGDILRQNGCLMFCANDEVKNLYMDNDYGWFSYFPMSLEIDITSRCNFECTHCNRSASPGNNMNLDLATIRRLATEAEQIGLRRIQILGGEPMCHPDFEDICRIFRQHGATKMFTSTNGWLVNDKTINTLSQCFNEVQVSIHSIHPNIHDSITQRKGSWERAINAIKLLIGKGVNVIISMAVMPNNIHEMKPMAEMAERLGANAIRYLALQKVGRGQAIDELQASDVRFAASIISCISNEHPMLRILSMGFPVQNKCQSSGSFWGCSAGRTLLNIKANGDVTSCSIVSKSVGSIHNNSIMNIWHCTEFRNLRQIHNKSCLISKFCGGHCKSLQKDPYISSCKP